MKSLAVFLSFVLALLAACFMVPRTLSAQSLTSGDVTSRWTILRPPIRIQHSNSGDAPEHFRGVSRSQQSPRALQIGAQLRF